MENGQYTLVDMIEEMCTQQDVCLKPMRIARDIMNTNVRTLTLDHTVNQFLKFMENHRVRHVPVVDLPCEGEKKPFFIGVVSQRDVLRLNSQNVVKNGKQKIDQKALRQLLVQIVARKPKSVSPQTPVQDVIMTMTLNHIDMVPVLDNADLVGVITTNDLMKLFFRLDKAAHQLFPKLKKGAAFVDMASESSARAKMLFSRLYQTVQEIMTEQVICLEPQDNLDRAIKIMQSEKCRHILITDEQGKFVGVVSDRDILQNLPYAGKRPPSPPKIFREYLFATDPWTESLQLTIESVMSRKTLNILPGRSVCKAADILYNKKISCLPVVDEQDKLCGIVTVTDLIRALLSVYEPVETAELIPSESGLPLGR